MTQRINYPQQAPELLRKLAELNAAVQASPLGDTIQDLVHIRASQLNGCAFCVDMHVKEATIHGERPLRLHHIAIWRESPLFSARERAALAWTEAVTRLPEGGVPDALFEEVRGQFSEKEITDLTFSVAVINAWNRLAVPFRSVPGSADKLYGIDKAGLN